MVNILENKFRGIIEELQKQKSIAKEEDNLILFYALENSIYTFSLLDGYYILYVNCRHNARDTLLRSIYETIFQNIFFFILLRDKKIEYGNKEIKIDTLKEILEKVIPIAKKSREEKIPFYEIEEKCNSLGCNEVITFFHEIRRCMRWVIKNNAQILPQYPSIDYAFIQRSMNTKSDFWVHNCFFISSQYECCLCETLDDEAKTNMHFFAYFTVCVMQDIFQFYGKSVEFENEEKLRKKFDTNKGEYKR